MLLALMHLASGCTKFSSDHVASVAASEVTVTAPTKNADASNSTGFSISGQCSSDVQVTVNSVTQTFTCSSGEWSGTLNLSVWPDGALTVTVTSSTDASQTATLDVTKSASPVCAGGPTVFSTNMSARYVLGQPDFVQNSVNQGGLSPSATTLNNPIGIIVNNGKLYVADAGNNRVLVYNSLPTANGVAANAVIGQVNFGSAATGTSSTLMNGIQAIAANGLYLAVTEWANARVSLWPLLNPTAAQYYWGQPDSTSNAVNNGGIGPASLGANAGIAAANGKFYVGDATNSRVLAFNGSALSTGQAALNVFGQTDFISSAVGSGLTGFGAPYSVSTDGTHLAIMDNNLERVLIYNSMPTMNGQPADVAWGGFGITSTGLNNPVGVSIGGGKLFIADRSSDRILGFNSIPTSAAQPADFVLGQADFTTADNNQCNCATAAANTLWGVHHVYWDGCRLYVTDKQNNRVLVY
ncbi:hypothetical protein BH10BDE1_BH10BDE1_32770 [soil metagenome]